MAGDGLTLRRGGTYTHAGVSNGTTQLGTLRDALVSVQRIPSHHLPPCSNRLMLTACDLIEIENQFQWEILTFEGIFCQWDLAGWESQDRELIDFLFCILRFA